MDEVTGYIYAQILSEAQSPRVLEEDVWGYLRVSWGQKPADEANSKATNAGVLSGSGSTSSGGQTRHTSPSEGEI